MKDERLIEAFNAWEELSQTPDTIIAYHSRLKSIIDEEAKLDYAEHKGIEKGIEKGIKQIAKKMINKGKSNEEIMEFTDLSVAEIDRIRHEK